MFGILIRQPVVLLGRVEESRRQNHHNSYIEIVLQHYKNHPEHDKFKYDHIGSKCNDVDCIISIMIMSSNAINEVYTLDKINGEELKRFMTERNV